MIAGKQKQVVAQELRAAREHHLQEEQQDRRHPGDEGQERAEHGQLADDVFEARERLGQVDLQRVGPPIVGDQPEPRSGS